MNKRKCIMMKFAVLLCILFSLNSCSSSDNNYSPESRTIEIRQMQFFPAELELHKFDTVIFINHDLVEHNITEESGKYWTSSALLPGKSWKLAITQSANYFCSIHPVMKGKLLITR